MSEPGRDDRRFSALESQIRAAGRYVRASDDLRPAVIEAARSERSASHGAASLAVCTGAAVLITWLAAGLSHRADVQRRQTAATIEQADVWQLDATVRERIETADVGANWSLADVLSTVRVRQAELLSGNDGAE